MGGNYKHIIAAVTVVLVTLGVGLAAGYYWGFHAELGIFNKKIDAIKPLRESNTSYQFIDPLLLYMVPSADSQWGLTSMKDQVQNIINTDKKNNGLLDASIYFQD